MTIRLFAALASITIVGATIPPATAQCASAQETEVSRMRTAMHSPLVRAVNHDAACRAFTVAFYDLVTMRQSAANCVRRADRDPQVVALDSEIDSFNDLIASRCGG